MTLVPVCEAFLWPWFPASVACVLRLVGKVRGGGRGRPWVTGVVGKWRIPACMAHGDNFTDTVPGRRPNSCTALNPRPEWVF